MTRRIDWKSGSNLLSAGVLAACCHVLADSMWRRDYPTELWVHVGAVLGLYAVVGTLLGLFLWLLVGIERRLTRLLAFAGEPARRFLGPAFFGAVAVLLSQPTAVAAFSGQRISRTPWGSFGPLLLLILVFASAALLSAHAARAQQGCLTPARWRQSFLGAVVAGGALLVIDQNVFVTLYRPLHSYLEWVSLLLLTLAFALVLPPRAPVGRRVLTGVSLLGVVLTGAILASGSLRERLDRALTHAWIDPVYAGRMLRRSNELAVYLKDPSGYRGIQMDRLERLRARFRLDDVELDASWLSTPPPLPPGQTRQELVERGLSEPNVLVFYIDTLRQDVAHDPSIMPHLARFARESLDFRRAYATGSDTLRSLPGITGGNYFLRHTHSGNVCELGKRSAHESSLFIAESAGHFLSRLLPSFDFEHEVRIQDFDPGSQVWGYGADKPTGERIVDAALDYLKRRSDEKFFMWLFHFDQHNWRELDSDYIDDISARFEVPTEGELDARYRAIASALDAQFGRLLAGLDELGLSDNTVVLLLSDHGEGLGWGGFWVHSVFLWESLVRVPLVLRVPGVAPQLVEDVVSLVDVAPTLAGFLLPEAPKAGYHGEDLLRHADVAPAPRRFPVLFAAALRDELVRIGTLDRAGRHKLVVRLEAAELELFDLETPTPDERNLARERPGVSRSLLRLLARSPVFPRSLEEFQMLRPQAELSFRAEPQELPASAAHELSSE